MEDCGRKKLAYEIQKMKEGYYYFIQFDADAATPNEIEQRVSSIFALTTKANSYWFIVVRTSFWSLAPNFIRARKIMSHEHIF